MCLKLKPQVVYMVEQLYRTTKKIVIQSQGWLSQKNQDDNREAEIQLKLERQS